MDSTLDRWLKVAENLLTKDEFELTKEVVHEFRHGDGPKLQKYLQKKAATSDSWIHDYWLAGAYLSARQPLAISSNYYLGHRSDVEGLDSLGRTATMTYYLVQFEKMLEEDKFPPVLLQNLVPLCMYGFSFVFNSTRIPHEHMDELVRFPGFRHIVVIRNGKYYKMDVDYTNSDGSKTPLTPLEIKIQFQKIIKLADEAASVLPVAALTTQNRNTWAQHRLELENSNLEILTDIDTCMFMVSLENDAPKDYAAHAKRTLTGDGANFWFDKCFNMAGYEDGWTGYNVEHSGIDAMVFTTTQEYSLVFEKYENKDVSKSKKPRALPSPVQLEWNLSGMENSINKAYTDYNALVADLQLTVSHGKYGKGYMKKQRISPDGYIQMCLQLAYYRMHKHVPKTYEPSTGRLFLLGRTETVHPVSEHSISWVKAMDDPLVNAKVKIDILKKAVKSQSEFRLTATIGQGCDRHLVAMLFAARELGMDIPKIFAEKTWQLPWLLSTSQTPTMLYEYGSPIDFASACGGFGPVDPNGYGLTYSILGDEELHFHITSWKTSETADAEAFAEHISQSMQDVKALFA